MSPAHLEILKSLIDMEARGALERASFDDIPISVYHHPKCPGISSTTIKTVLKRSWNHIGVKDGERESFRFGSAFHCFNNEPHLFQEQYTICPFDYRRGQDWEAFKARAGGKIILMQKDLKCIEAMSTKLWLNPDAFPLLKDAKYEITYFVRDQATGVLKKCRVDAIKGLTISDLKTTQDASLSEFRWDAKKFDYGISAAYYCEVTSQFYGQLINDFRLIACEKGEPNEICVYRVSDESMANASDEIRVALKRIEVIRKDPTAWRGYALGQTISI